MSHKSRRALQQAIGAKPGQVGKKQLAEDVCQVCAFIAANIIGHRENDFTLQDGTLVELGVNKRLEPPLGIRFPKSAAKRTKCLACGGVGRFGCQTCHGLGTLPLSDQPCGTCGGNGKVACEKCAGFGYNWDRSDFAPTCPLCSQFIMAWLKEREQMAMVKQGSPVQKIIVPSQQQATRLARGIILP